MRAFLLLLVLLPTIALAQTTDRWPYTLEDTFGKTETQVLAMGRQKWFDFFVEQPGGSSTAGMCDAEQIFGNALKRRNNRILTSGTAERRVKFNTLRKRLAEYGEACTEISATFSGGGTLWNNVHAGVLPDTEELIGTLLGLPSKPAPARTTGEVTKRLAEVESVLRKHKAEIDTYRGSGYGSAYGLKEAAKARKAYAGIVEIAKTLPRGLSDAVLDACYKRAMGIEFNLD